MLDILSYLVENTSKKSECETFFTELQVIFLGLIYILAY